jgi:hypothetical protein
MSQQVPTKTGLKYRINSILHYKPFSLFSILAHPISYLTEENKKLKQYILSVDWCSPEIKILGQSGIHFQTERNGHET